MEHAHLLTEGLALACGVHFLDLLLEVWHRDVAHVGLGGDVVGPVVVRSAEAPDAREAGGRAEHEAVGYVLQTLFDGGGTPGGHGDAVVNSSHRKAFLALALQHHLTEGGTHMVAGGGMCVRAEGREACMPAS